MDAVLLARIQFALTVGFHFLFPPLTIGMAWIIFWMMLRYRRTGDEVWGRAARFWIRLFAVSFAIGVASGLVMEFQFGTNWAAYSRFVGDVFGTPLAIEAIAAFFLEAVFLGVLLAGWNRVSVTARTVAAAMVALGATLSAFWILVANSWQQTPAGYALRNGRAELVDFAAAVFNPSTWPRFFHTLDGCLVTGAFFVMGASALLLLRGRHSEVARRSMKVALAVGLVAAVAQLPLGHWHAVQVAHTQPAKLAAIEGIFDTQTEAPALIFGIPDEEAETVHARVAVPGLLSLLAEGRTDAEIKGLKDFPPDERPPVALTFYPFHLMVVLGMWFIVLTLWGAVLWRRGRLADSRRFLRAAAWSIPLPFVANELGWITAEVGRQPWVVYGVLKTRDAVSAVVPASHVLGSILMFACVYALLFVLWIALLRRQIRRGPEPAEGGAPRGEVAA